MPLVGTVGVTLCSVKYATEVPDNSLHTTPCDPKHREDTCKDWIYYKCCRWTCGATTPEAATTKIGVRMPPGVSNQTEKERSEDL